MTFSFSFLSFFLFVLQELQEEQTSCLSPLCELLGVSHTSVLAVPPVVIPEDCMFVSGSTDVDVRGERILGEQDIKDCLAA